MGVVSIAVSTNFVNRAALFDSTVKTYEEMVPNFVEASFKMPLVDLHSCDILVFIRIRAMDNNFIDVSHGVKDFELMCLRLAGFC